VGRVGPTALEIDDGAALDHDRTRRAALAVIEVRDE
jgi:hypothetical protein